MINKLRYFFSFLPPSENKKAWLLLAALIKLPLIAYFLYSFQKAQPGKFEGPFAIKMGDFQYFYETVEMLISKGLYSLYGDVPFAGRMPGLAVPYYIIRQFFDLTTSVNLIVVSQILLGIISVYLIALTARNLFNSERAFYISFFLSAFFPITTLYDLFTWAESLSVSFMVFSAYNLSVYMKSDKSMNLLAAGFFMGWAVFLRPFLALVIFALPFILFYLIFFIQKKGLRTAVIHLLIFCLPFMLFESIWVTRNYMHFKRIILLETPLPESYGESSAYRSSAIAVRTMIFSWGGITANFYSGSDAEWFFSKEDKKHKFPEYVFNSGFTYDSLVNLKKIFLASGDLTLDEKQRESYNQQAKQIAERYAAAYKSKNKFRYYVINPIKRTKILLTTGTYLFPFPSFSKMNITQKLVKGFSAVFCLLITAIGLIGGLYYLLKMKDKTIPLLLLATPLSLIYFGVFYSDWQANRYFIAGYPFLILISTLLFDKTIKEKELNTFSR